MTSTSSSDVPPKVESEETADSKTSTSSSDVPPKVESETADSKTSTSSSDVPPKVESEPKYSKASTKTSIQLLLRPVGDAPIAKQQKWNVDATRSISHVGQFFRKYLKLDSNEQKTLVLFVNQCFAPSPDETLQNLYDCFGSGDGKLVLHYCLTMAWG